VSSDGFDGGIVPVEGEGVATDEMEGDPELVDVDGSVQSLEQQRAEVRGPGHGEQVGVDEVGIGGEHGAAEVLEDGPAVEIGQQLQHGGAQPRVGGLGRTGGGGGHGEWAVPGPVFSSLRPASLLLSVSVLSSVPCCCIHTLSVSICLDTACLPGAPCLPMHQRCASGGCGGMQQAQTGQGGVRGGEGGREGGRRARGSLACPSLSPSPCPLPLLSSAMAAETVDTLIAQLEEKIAAELQGDSVGSIHAYETLQYVQSFVARKKKNLGNAGTSKAIFHAVKLLIGQASKRPAGTVDEAAMASTAGSLLKWFIEDGAGRDHSFHMHAEQTNSDNYCDVQNVLHLLEHLDVKYAGPIVDTIYNPLHVVLAKSKIKRNSPLQKRLHKLEIVFADVLLRHKKWLGAFKSYVRLNDADKVAEVLNLWSAEGYPSEKPLFFARGLLHILADNKASLAKDLLHASLPMVPDNIATGVKGGGPLSASLALWHLATILTDLSNFQPMPRVDKTKLFGLLYRRYGPLLNQMDSKLFELFLKAGEHHCNFRLEVPDTTPNPMAMLQSLLTGGASNSAQQQQQQQAVSRSAPPAGGPSFGGMDLQTMMNMMNRLQALSK
jgi:hypothetical protein